MSMSVLRLVSSAALALLAGCAMIPPEPVVTGPTTAAPPPPPSTPAQPTGSIYQPTAYGNYPLFEDRRPRNVGDIVTIVLNERTNASKNVATNTNRSGSANLGIAAAPSFMDSWANANLNTDAKGGNVSQGKGDSTANNAFTGTITTTVVGVMSNGNLQVAGEKQIAINRGSEYVRFGRGRSALDHRHQHGIVHAGGRCPHRVPQQGRHGRGPDHGLAAALLPDCLAFLMRQSPPRAARFLRAPPRTRKAGSARPRS